MEEDDPGIPIRTAEMKDPETPPIQIASSKIKEVSVESPNVTGRRSAIPKVALSPGIAPNTIPRHTMPKIIKRLRGFKQSNNADK